MIISVVIPVYNGLGVIEDCLESLYVYTGSHQLQIIAVDDFSTDGSREYLKSQTGRIRLLLNPQNESYAATVNRGIEASRSDAVLLLNQDTVVNNNAIDVLASQLYESDDYAMAAPRLANPDGSLQRSIRNFPTHADVINHHLGLTALFPSDPEINRWKMPGFDYDSESLVKQPMFSAVMLKREVIEKVGYLDHRFPLFFNDVDYCRRIDQAGLKVIYTPQAEIIHVRGQATSQQAVKSVYLQHLAFIQYLQKYYKGIRYLIPNLLCAVLLVTSAHLRAVLGLLKRTFTSKA
jgi:hypothetical protein